MKHFFVYTDPDQSALLRTILRQNGHDIHVEHNDEHAPVLVASVCANHAQQELRQLLETNHLRGYFMPA